MSVALTQQSRLYVAKGELSFKQYVVLEEDYCCPKVSLEREPAIRPRTGCYIVGCSPKLGYCFGRLLIQGRRAQRLGQCQRLRRQLRRQRRRVRLIYELDRHLRCSQEAFGSSVILGRDRSNGVYQKLEKKVEKQ